MKTEGAKKSSALHPTSAKYPKPCHTPNLTPGGGTVDGDNHPTPAPSPEPHPNPVKIKVTDKNAIAEGFNKYCT